MIHGVHNVAAKRKRFSVKIGLCLIVSALIHVSFVSILFRVKIGQTEPTPVASTGPVKIRIVPSNPKTLEADAQVAAKPSVTAKNRGAYAKRKTAKNETISSPGALTSSKERKTPVFQRYDQLFPHAGIDFPIADIEPESKPDTSIRGFDPENDDIPDATKMRHLSKLSIFGKDLAELITVPSALRKIEPNGTARARFSRKGGEWKVSEAAGDPYFRALLYETLSGLSPDFYGLVVLAASEFESVRVHFEFRTISVVDQTTKPIDIKIDGNKIFIVMTRQEADPKWLMLMASPAGLPTINLLGVGWVLAKPHIEPDPNADIEVKRLRLSPAFVRPIGR